MQLETFVDQSLKATTIEDLNRLLEKGAADLGYDRFLYSQFTDHEATGLPNGHGVVHNYPMDWVNHYTANDYQVIDPVIATATASNGPFVWGRHTQLSKTH